MTLHERIDAFVATCSHGWCTPFKAKWLADHILREHLNHVVEIGVFTGRSLIPMGLAVQELARGGYVLGIDPYSLERQTESVEIEGHITWARDIPYEQFHCETLAAIRSAGVSECCGLIRAASDEIACLIGPLDLLHIDGCHSVLASSRDVEVWTPKVRSGGLIVLDDATWSSVAEARAMLRDRCGPPSFTSDDGWECYRKP